jgi:hypothetical protein
MDLNNYFYTFYNFMEDIKYMMNNILIRNQQLEYDIQMIQDMNEKLTVLNGILVNDNKSMKEKLDIKRD